jgi:HD-like signal output (HDOD) protein
MKWFQSQPQGQPDDENEKAATGDEPAASDPGTAGRASRDPVAGPAPQRLADFFLVFEEHLTPIEKEDMESYTAQLRKPPTVLERVSRGLDDPEDLTETVMANPALSADVLRIVNSAAFRLNAPIASVQHAVTYLGTNLVKGLVLQAAVGQMLALESPAQYTAYMRLWRASYVASAVAQTLATELDLPEPSETATRALLANIGDLALISARPDLAGLYSAHATLFDRVSGQQDAITGNAAVIGALLAQAWKLPADIEAHLRHCYVPMVWPPERQEETGLDIREHVIVYFANRVGDAVTFGRSQQLEDFSIDAIDAPELFYLPSYLAAAGLADLPERLAAPDHSRKLQQLIDRFGD